MERFRVLSSCFNKLKFYSQLKSCSTCQKRGCNWPHCPTPSNSPQKMNNFVNCMCIKTVNIICSNIVPPQFSEVTNSVVLIQTCTLLSGCLYTYTFGFMLFLNMCMEKSKHLSFNNNIRMVFTYMHFQDTNIIQVSFN